MKKAVLILFFLLAVGFHYQGFSQSVSRSQFVADQASLVSEFDVGGLKVILKRRPQSATVAGGLFIRGGARNNDAKNAGIERLMLASAIEAGKNFSRETVRRELSWLGSTIGSGVNYDYSVASLATTRQDFDRAFDIFSDVLLSPLFDTKDVERNRELILASLRENSAVPEAAIDSMSDKIIYAGHPYANNPDGTPATIGSFTVADLRAYHKKIMEKSRLLLVFVGDLNPEDLKRKVEQTFGKLPRGQYTEEPIRPLNFSAPGLDVSARTLPTNYVKGIFAAPSLKDPDYYAMRVAIAILQTLVYQEVRGRLQLSYAPDAEMENFAANTANISVSTVDPNRAVQAMLEQIRFLQFRTLRDEVIDEIAAFFLTRYYMGQETSAAQAAELARYELLGGGWRKSFEFIDRVRAVRPDDIRNSAVKYMRNIRFVYIGDPSMIDRRIFLQ
ncbi:MAG: M16 family metallopeptidase [Pyrinomonadaceae bacterium]